MTRQSSNMSSDGGAPTGFWESQPPDPEKSSGPPDMTKINAHLKVQRPDVPEVDIPIEKAEFFIGRDPNMVDLVLDDELVSRKHARIKFGGRGYVQLLDLDSKNGIEFQGRTVRKLNLVDGDAFAIGKAQFVFHAKLERYRAVPSSESPVIEANAPMEDDMSLLAEDIPEPIGSKDD